MVYAVRSKGLVDETIAKCMAMLVAGCVAPIGAQTPPRIREIATDRQTDRQTDRWTGQIQNTFSMLICSCRDFLCGIRFSFYIGLYRATNKPRFINRKTEGQYRKPEKQR